MSAMEYPNVPAAFINAIAEEGTKAEAVEWLQRTWNECYALRARVAELGPNAARYVMVVRLGLIDGFVEGYCADNDLDEAPSSTDPLYKNLADAAIDAAARKRKRK